MFTKNELLTKIDYLQTYCEQNRETGVSGDFGTFILPLKTAVNTYFNTIPNNLKYSMMKLITQIDVDIQKRYTTYEHEYGDSPSTNYPYGYNDFTIIFNGDDAFDEITNISGAAFLAGFPKTPDLVVPTNYVYETNPIIDIWAQKIQNAHNAEIAKIENIIDFCERGSYNDGIISLFEDRGKMTVNRTKQQLANDIYIVRGAKVIIQSMNLGVYIPSYI